MSDAPPPSRIEELLREVAPQVLTALLRRVRDFGAAEDAVQEALLAAAQHWPQEGTPESPRGWLIQVAFRRLTDQLRSEKSRRRREDTLAAEADHEQQLAVADAALGAGPAAGELADSLPFAVEGDDTLLLLVMCCHPSLTPASAIALTLRAVGGLTTAEIAKAFLVPEATMSQRITRAKQSIKEAGASFQMPGGAEWAAREKAVLHVLYLMFNEGYTSSVGPSLQRSDLSSEAIRLTRMVKRLRPDDPEVAGLLALMLLTDARRLARTNDAGDLIPLAEQDRTLWDRAAISEGVALVSGALSRGSVGPYQLQAAIAAVHDEAERAEDTDWPQILALYGLLERMSDNPMVTLNRAIALAMVEGPQAGLALLSALQSGGRLQGNHRLDAVRGHLLERAGEEPEAITAYRRAASLTDSLPEQRYLLSRAARLADRHGKAAGIPPE